MPSLRRPSLANRTQSSSVNSSSNSGQQRANHNNCIAESSSGSNLNFANPFGTFHTDVPKHLSIPYPSSDHALVYETVVLVFSLSAFSLQLLHLYRTVWWLPQSYTQFALKFYLVNPYLVGFVLTLSLPRWLWAFCKTSVDFLLPVRWQRKTKYHIQTGVLAVSCLAHIYCAALVTVAETANYENLVEMGSFRFCCLLYPAVIVSFIYKTDVRRYLDLVPDYYNGIGNSPDSQTVDFQHQCSSDPLKARQEVEWLRNDFNARLQNVLLHSYNMALACTLFPCCFVQNFIHFDIAIAMQHFLLVWAGGITINAIHAFPPKYCDILHRAAKHLGYWDHVGTYSSGSAGASCVDWCPRTTWKQGSLVRLENEVYRARGDFNSAEPGTVHHQRFYALFINAALFQVCLLVFQLTLVIIQFVLLVRSSEWYQMISLSLLQASGGYALFKLTRDSVVVWRLSLAEEIVKNA